MTVRVDVGVSSLAFPCVPNAFGLERTKEPICQWPSDVIAASTLATGVVDAVTKLHASKCGQGFQSRLEALWEPIVVKGVQHFVLQQREAEARDHEVNGPGIAARKG